MNYELLITMVGGATITSKPLAMPQINSLTHRLEAGLSKVDAPKTLPIPMSDSDHSEIVVIANVGSFRAVKV